MTLILKMFTRRWWWVTIVVLLGVLFLVRLGVWQLDRLQQRRAQNALVAARWNQEPLNLNQTPVGDDLETLGYRRIQASGSFDYERQIILSNQSMPDTAPGVMLITPLILDNNQAVLVARGLVYYNDTQANGLTQYNEESEAQLVGLARASDTNPDTPILENGQQEWHRIDIPAIQHQMPYQLLPFFIEQLPEPGRSPIKMPVRQIPEDVQMISDEGNHFSYAIQWFSFALMLAVGYPFFIRWQEMREKRIQEESSRSAADLPESVVDQKAY